MAVQLKKVDEICADKLWSATIGDWDVDLYGYINNEKEEGEETLTIPDIVWMEVEAHDGDTMEIVLSNNGELCICTSCMISSCVHVQVVKEALKLCNLMNSMVIEIGEKTDDSTVAV